MFSVITNIYNKKNQRTYLNGIVHSHRKTKKFFFSFLVAVNNSIKVDPLVFLL